MFRLNSRPGSGSKEELDSFVPKLLDRHAASVTYMVTGCNLSPLRFGVPGPVEVRLSGDLEIGRLAGRWRRRRVQPSLRLVAHPRQARKRNGDLGDPRSGDIRGPAFYRPIHMSEKSPTRTLAPSGVRKLSSHSSGHSFRPATPRSKIMAVVKTGRVCARTRVRVGQLLPVTVPDQR